MAAKVWLRTVRSLAPFKRDLFAQRREEHGPHDERRHEERYEASNSRHVRPQKLDVASEAPSYQVPERVRNHLEADCQRRCGCGACRPEVETLRCTCAARRHAGCEPGGWSKAGNRRLRRRLARAPEVVAGHQVARPLAWERRVSQSCQARPEEARELISGTATTGHCDHAGEPLRERGACKAGNRSRHCIVPRQGILGS